MGKRPDNTKRIQSVLLIGTGWLWFSLPLLWLLPLNAAPEFGRGLLVGIVFVYPLVMGPCISGVSIWGGIRGHGIRYYWVAALSTPPTLFFWWLNFFGSIPGTRFQ